MKVWKDKTENLERESERESERQREKGTGDRLRQQNSLKS